MKATLGLVFGVLMLPALASAQPSIQGQWAGEIPGDGTSQSQLVQMAITVGEDRIHGSIIADGEELSIEDATVTDDIVEFTTTRRDATAATKFLWRGTISGDEIAFSSVVESRDSPAVEFVVRRQP